jgi:hypothetical protein
MTDEERVTFEKSQHALEQHPCFTYTRTRHPTNRHAKAEDMPRPEGEGWEPNVDLSRYGDGVAWEEEPPFPDAPYELTYYVRGWRRHTREDLTPDAQTAMLEIWAIGQKQHPHYAFARFNATLVDNAVDLHAPIRLMDYLYRLFPEMASADAAGQPWCINMYHPTTCGFTLTGKSASLEVYKPDPFYGQTT